MKKPTTSASTSTSSSTSTSDLFIPTLEQWGRYVEAWTPGLVKRLWKHGDEEARAEAVHEAFLKLMGCHNAFQLQKAPEPQTEKDWWWDVYGQAKFILQHRSEAAARFVHRSVTDEFESLDFGDVEPNQRSWEKADLVQRIRAAVWTACRQGGVSVRDARAFVHFVLDGMPGEHVVRAVPEVGKANNLYQIKKRVLSYLMEVAQEPGNPFEELRAA